MSAATVNYPEEGAGIALAAKKLDIPAVIGFTLETDGSLPDGTGAQFNTKKIGLSFCLKMTGNSIYFLTAGNRKLKLIFLAKI